MFYYYVLLKNNNKSVLQTSVAHEMFYNPVL